MPWCICATTCTLLKPRAHWRQQRVLGAREMVALQGNWTRDVQTRGLWCQSDRRSRALMDMAGTLPQVPRTRPCVWESRSQPARLGNEARVRVSTRAHRAEQSSAEQSRAEQSRAEQSRAGQSRIRHEPDTNQRRPGADTTHIRHWPLPRFLLMQRRRRPLPPQRYRRRPPQRFLRRLAVALGARVVCSSEWFRSDALGRAQARAQEFLGILREDWSQTCLLAYAAAAALASLPWASGGGHTYCNQNRKTHALRKQLSMFKSSRRREALVSQRWPFPKRAFRSGMSSRCAGHCN